MMDWALIEVPTNRAGTSKVTTSHLPNLHHILTLTLTLCSFLPTAYPHKRAQQPVFLPSDSGSLVFNRTCRVVRMVIGGGEMEPFTFITHIDDLFRDIKASTGAAMVRVQEA